MPQPLDLAQRAARETLIRISCPMEDVAFRDNTDTGGWTFEGVASVVDHPYPVRDQFGEYTETIKTGAFNKTLRDSKAPISLYVNHQHTAFPFAARNAKARTLTLSADPNLRVRAELDSTRPDVQILRSVVDRGEMPEMSIGFRPVKARDKWATDYASVERGEVALREVSIVEQGANTGGTETAMRSLEDLIAGVDDVEMSHDECGRVLRSFERRFSDMYADEARGLLRAALVSRFNPSDRQYVWIRDFSDAEVIFELDGYPASGTYRLSYTRDGLSMDLDTNEPTRVVPTVSYVPEKRSDFDERDRLARALNEQRKYDRIPLLVN